MTNPSKSSDWAFVALVVALVAITAACCLGGLSILLDAGATR